MIEKIRGFPKRTSSRHVHILSPLILAACGSSGQQGGSEASISLSNGSYSGNLPDGFLLPGSSSATIQVLNMSMDSDEILLSGSGTGQLEFSFVDPNDRLTLQSGSKVSGFNTLKITNGAVDVTQASLTGIETIVVASEATLNYEQVKYIKNILSSDASGKILVHVRDDAELESFMSQLSSGQLKIYADANPLQLLNGEKSVSVTMLETQQAATNSYIKLYSTYDNTTANNAYLKIDDDLFVTNASADTKLTVDGSTKTIKLLNGTEAAASEYKYDAISNIEIAQGKTLVLSANDFEMIEAEISGSGNLKVTDITIDSDFAGIKSSGKIEFYGEADAKSLNALDEVVSNAIDATAITKISGSASDIKNVLDDQLSIKTANDVLPITTGASADLAVLKFIEEKTTGFVDAIAHTSLTGTTSEALAILVTRQGTSGDKIDTASSALVTIDDATGTNVQAADLASIGGATTGLVKLSNTLNATGSANAFTSALVSADTKVSANTISVSITSASTSDAGVDYLAQLKAINAATSGSITLSSSGATTALSGSASDLKSALSGITSHNGFVTVSSATTSNAGVDYLAQLKAINAATSGTITLSSSGATTALSGSASDLNSALSGITSHNGLVTVSSATTSNAGVDYLAQLKTINAATSGTIVLSSSGATTVLSGSASDLNSALSGITTYVGSATVTTEADVSSANTLAQKSVAIFSAGITDTVSNFVNSSSSAVQAALTNAVNDDADVNLKLSNGSGDQTAVDINLIEEATAGVLNLGLVNGIVLADDATADIKTSTVNGAIVQFKGTGDDSADETVTLTGTNVADTVNLRYVSVDGDDIAKLTVNLGAGDDIFTDSVGVDEITGGTGADQITLSTGGNDKIIYSTASDGGVAGATSGNDVITNFTSAADAVVISGSLKTAYADGGDGTLNLFAASDNDDAAKETVDLTAANTAEGLFVDETQNGTFVSGDLTDLTKVATLFDSAFTLTSADGEDALLILESDTAGTFGLYHFVDTATATNTVDAAELSILAIVTANDVVVGDISF